MKKIKKIVQSDMFWIIIFLIFVTVIAAVMSWIKFIFILNLYEKGLIPKWLFWMLK